MKTTDSPFRQKHYRSPHRKNPSTAAASDLSEEDGCHPFRDPTLDSTTDSAFSNLVLHHHWSGSSTHSSQRRDHYRLKASRGLSPRSGTPDSTPTVKEIDELTAFKLKQMSGEFKCVNRDTGKTIDVRDEHALKKMLRKLKFWKSRSIAVPNRGNVWHGWWQKKMQVRSQFFDGVRRGDVPLVDYCLNRNLNPEFVVDADTPDDQGSTGLHVAADQNRQEMAKFLVTRVSDVDIIDRNGRTALHIASIRGHVTIVRHLVECGASLDAQDKDGNTAIHYTSKRGEKELLKWLMDRRPNLYIKNNRRQSASDLANTQSIIGVFVSTGFQ